MLCRPLTGRSLAQSVSVAERSRMVQATAGKALQDTAQDSTSLRLSTLESRVSCQTSLNVTPARTRGSGRGGRCREARSRHRVRLARFGSWVSLWELRIPAAGRRTGLNQNLARGSP